MVRFLKRFAVWLVICGLSAIPSFWVGYSIFSDPVLGAAMITGIVLFALGYAFVTGTAFVRRLKSRRAVRRTILIGYTTRLVISVLPFVGIFVDMYCGLLSMAVVGTFLGDGETFVNVLAITLVQGVVLNIVLAAYMLLLLPFVSWLTKARPAEACERCGYDLRESGDVCPECGTARPVPADRVAA